MNFWTGLAGGLVLGVGLGIWVIALFQGASDSYPLSPPAPPRCRCGHQPWQHVRFEENEHGLPDLGCCLEGDCACFDYRPEEVR